MKKYDGVYEIFSGKTHAYWLYHNLRFEGEYIDMWDYEENEI